MSQHQHTAVSDNVVQGDLVVVPTQEASDSPFPEWAEAVLRGPLEAAEEAETTREAIGLAERGEHEAAGERFLRVSATLDRRGFSPAAILIRERAAHEFADGDQSERAGELFLEVARARLEGEGEGSSSESAARRAQESLPAERSWVAAGLLARSRWPALSPEDPEALRAAAEQARGTGEESEWVAVWVEHLLLSGKFADAARAAGSTRREVPLAEGSRLDLELDALDAVEEAEGVDSVEPSWRDLTAWADDVAARWPGDTARVWQRRGVVLAHRDDLEGASRAFSQAIAAWGRLRGYEDQVAEAFWAAENAALLLGSTAPVLKGEARTLAAAMRGYRRNSATIAERLELRGLRERSEGDLRPAAIYLQRSHNRHRRAGNFRGTMALSQSLGEVLVAAGHPALATSYFIQAGKGKEATSAAEAARAQDLVPALRVDGPRWQKAATYRVIRSIGRTVPDELVAAWAPRMVADVEAGSSAGLAPDPAVQAVGALAACILGIPDPERSRVLELLRECMRLDPKITRRVADALAAVTRLGISDETMPLVRAFLDENGFGAVKSLFVAQLIAERPEAGALVREAAREGHVDALEALAAADLIDEGELVAQCSSAIVAATASPQRVHQSDQGVSTVSVGMYVTLSHLGLFGRFASPDARHSLLEWLLESLLDSELPSVNRTQAAEALFNFVPGLDRDEAERCIGALRLLASSTVDRSSLEDFASNNPLAAIRFEMPPPEELRAAALAALAELVRYHGLDSSSVMEAVKAALITGGDIVIAAAFDALARHPDLVAPVPLESALSHPDVRVRRAAMKASWARTTTLPTEGELERLLSDPEPGVRNLLAVLAAELGHEGSHVIDRLADDADAWVRAWARKLQSGLEVS